MHAKTVRLREDWVRVHLVRLLPCVSFKNLGSGFMGVFFRHVSGLTILVVSLRVLIVIGWYELGQA